MKLEDQRIAIAEACGWKLEAIEREIGIYADHVWVNGADRKLDLPDYLNDLNAMHEAEKEVWQNDWAGYYATLAAVMKISTEDMSLIHATAAQRAEAFLRTIGKWI